MPEVNASFSFPVIFMVIWSPVVANVGSPPLFDETVKAVKTGGVLSKVIVSTPWVTLTPGTVKISLKSIINGISKPAPLLSSIVG